MNDQFNEARELANLLLEPDSRISPTLVQGVVQSINVDGHVSLYLSGMAFPVSKVKHLDSYDPRASDTVWVLKNGPDLLIIGKVAEANPTREDATLPWNVAWGMVAQADGTGTAFNAATPNQLILADVPLIGGRRYRFTERIRWRVSVADTLVNWAMAADPGTGYVTLRNVATTSALATGANMSKSVQWSEFVEPATDLSYDFRIIGARVTATSSDITPNFVAIDVEDVGPVARI